MTPICKTKPINTLIFAAFVDSHFRNYELLLITMFWKTFSAKAICFSNKKLNHLIVEKNFKEKSRSQVFWFFNKNCRICLEGHRWLSFSLPPVPRSLSLLFSPSSAIRGAAGRSSCGGWVPRLSPDTLMPPLTPPLVRHLILRIGIGPVPKTFCSSSSSSIVSDSVPPQFQILCLIH